MVHQKDRIETACRDFRKPNGSKKIPQTIIHDLKIKPIKCIHDLMIHIALSTNLESNDPSGKVPAIKSPQTTTYKMHVIRSSMICAMLTILAPTFLPKQTLAIAT